MITLDRRRILGIAAVLLAILLLAELVVRLVAPHLPSPLEWSSDEAQVKVEDMRAQLSQAPRGVVFVGSSIVDAAVDPARFNEITKQGRPAYNAALLGSPMEMIELWTTKVVLPIANPALVVVGVTCREINAAEEEQQTITEDFKSAPAMRERLGAETSLDRVERRAADISYLVRYRTVFRQPRNLIGRDRRRGHLLDVAQFGMNTAFENVQYPPIDQLTKVLNPGAITRFRIGGEQLRSLRRLLLELRAQRIGVLVVSMPVTEDFVSWMPKGRADHEACVRAIDTASNSAGASHLDAGVWERRFFADPIHVNRSGAARLTSVVADATLRLNTDPWDT